MTKNEIAYIAAFLEDLHDRYSNAGCNDLTLPYTPENLELSKKAEKWWYEENDCNEEFDEIKPVKRGKNEVILTNDQCILSYLQHLLMKEYGLTKKNLPQIGG